MAGERAVRPTCEDTGLAVPECSCQSCLEAMLREHLPVLRVEEIKITRRSDRHGEDPGAAERREAA